MASLLERNLNPQWPIQIMLVLLDISTPQVKASKILVSLSTYGLISAPVIGAVRNGLCNREREREVFIYGHVNVVIT